MDKDLRAVIIIMVVSILVALISTLFFGIGDITIYILLGTFIVATFIWGWKKHSSFKSWMKEFK